MIFVTVGTHEQGFDRLIKALDELKGKNLIQDEIYIQKGFTDYEPKHCLFQKFFSASEMADFTKLARIVISHGGPATYMAAIAQGIPTIIVPRLSKFNEHVNDHQLVFANKINETGDYHLNIVTDMEKLLPMINQCADDNIVKDVLVSHTKSFNLQFSKILESLL